MMRRYTTGVLAVLFGVTAFAGQAIAQSISDENRDEAVDESTRQEASKRVESQSERLDKEEKGTKGKKRPGYSQEDVKADKMSADEIEKLKRRLEDKNREMIKKLDRLIKQDPYSDQKPQWMFQKAELLWELRNMEYLRKRAEYNKCMKAARQGTTDKSKCKEPKPNYTDAQKIYKKILTQFPDYKRLDEVIYRLGQGLIEADKGSQAVSYLQRLVE
ncbi:MAG: tol-pal system YbgF family protein, partial [Bradymonadaceae bacterium]